MHLVFCDFETFFSDVVSLKKMSPGEYLAHPEFELISASIRVDRGRKRGEVQVYFGHSAIYAALVQADISNAYFIGHNCDFDGAILVSKLNLHPRMFGDTLSMARPILGHLTSLGLGALVKYLNIGVKNDAILYETKGRHLKDFTLDEIERMRTYNCDDTWQCAAVFYWLVKYFSANELWQIDCTLRATFYPQLEVDQPLLEQTLVREQVAKREALLGLADALGVSPCESDDATFEAVRARLASAPKFVSLLESLGVDVPYKPSPGDSSKLIPALAKTDEGFLELLESDDELVAQAAQARLSIKSTLLATRIDKLLMARRCSTALPIPLRYAGARVTDRWSGALYNPQNLPRIIKNVPKNSDALRQSIVAPEGFVIGVSDASAIELRVNHHLWMVPRTVSLYKENPVADLYRDFAGTYFHKAPADVSDHERQFGKVSHLQLQFGSGWQTFQRTAKAQHKMILTDEVASAGMYGWRDTYREIPGGWDTCAEALHYIAEGSERQVDPGGLCHTMKDGIRLPSGSILRYPDLRQQLMLDTRTGKEKWEWVYGRGRFVRRIYGPKVVANLVQKLARDVVAEVAVQFFNETGYRWVMMVHDELVYVFPEARGVELLAALQKLMRQRRTWWKDMVLWSSGGLGHRYSEAH